METKHCPETRGSKVKKISFAEQCCLNRNKSSPDAIFLRALGKRLCSFAINQKGTQDFPEFFEQYGISMETFEKWLCNNQELQEQWDFAQKILLEILMGHMLCRELSIEDGARITRKYSEEEGMLLDQIIEEKKLHRTGARKGDTLLE